MPNQTPTANYSSKSEVSRGSLDFSEFHKKSVFSGYWQLSFLLCSYISGCYYCNSFINFTVLSLYFNYVWTEICHGFSWPTGALNIVSFKYWILPIDILNVSSVLWFCCCLNIATKGNSYLYRYYLDYIMSNVLLWWVSTFILLSVFVLFSFC